jgi:hypothetical protein
MYPTVPTAPTAPTAPIAPTAPASSLYPSLPESIVKAVVVPPPATRGAETLANGTDSGGTAETLQGSSNALAAAWRSGLASLRAMNAARVRDLRSKKVQVCAKGDAWDQWSAAANPPELQEGVPLRLPTLTKLFQNRNGIPKAGPGNDVESASKEHAAVVCVEDVKSHAVHAVGFWVGISAVCFLVELLDF